MQTLKQANEVRRITGQARLQKSTTSLPWNIREVTPNGIWFTTSDGPVFVTNTAITNLKNLTNAGSLQAIADAWNGEDLTLRVARTELYEKWPELAAAIDGAVGEGLPLEGEQ